MWRCSWWYFEAAKNVMMQVGMGIFRTRLEGFFEEIFPLERKMVCGKCCWSHLFKALHVDSFVGVMVKQQTFTFLSRYNVLLWITWYCFLYFLSVFQESSKNYEAFRIRRHLDVACKDSVSSAIEASTSPLYSCCLSRPFPVAKVILQWHESKKSQLAGRRYGTKALMGILIFAALWYCPKDGSNIDWIGNEVTLIVRGPKRWWQHLGGFHEWCCGYLVVLWST